MLPTLIAIALGQTSSHDLIDLSQLRLEEYRKIQDIRDRLAGTKLQVDPMTALMTDPSVRSMGLDTPSGRQIISEALSYRFDRGVISGYHAVEPGSSDPILKMTVPRIDDKGKAKFESLEEVLKGEKVGVYKVKATMTPLPVPGGPAPKPPEIHETYLGVLFRNDLASYIKLAEGQSTPGVPVKIHAEILEDTLIPAQIYDNASGKALIVLSKVPSQPLFFPSDPVAFWLSKRTAPECQKAYDSRDPSFRPDQEPSFAVKTPGGIVDIEHLRRETYLGLQKLRDEVRAKHPTNADYPPEMLQTEQFKNTGLNLSLPGDLMTFRDALAYKPEGTPLKGYHPVDFAKDKVAGLTSLATKDATGMTVTTFKEMFQGKKLYIYRLRTEPAKQNPSAPNQAPMEAYYGPWTPETLEAVKKSKPETKVTDLKEQDIPVNIFTDKEGDVAFVLAFRPKDLLTLPQRPQVIVASDSVDVMKPLEKPDRDMEQKLVPTLHQLKVDFAFEKVVR